MQYVYFLLHKTSGSLHKKKSEKVGLLQNRGGGLPPAKLFPFFLSKKLLLLDLHNMNMQKVDAIFFPIPPSRTHPENAQEKSEINFFYEGFPYQNIEI